MGAGTILLVVAAIAAALGIYYYNSFVVKKNMIGQAYSTIDVMLQRRADLVPNLVTLVERYMRHEKAVLTRIAELRAMAVDRRGSLDSRMAADGEMDRLIGRVMLQVEQYADLRADAQVARLAASLESMEGQIAASRHAHNAAVMVYNTYLEEFPRNVAAWFFGFKRKDLLRAAASGDVPVVKDLLDNS